MLRPRFTIFSLISLVLCRSQVTVPTYCRTVTYVYAYFPAYFYFLKCIKNFANCFSLCYNGVMQRWSSWLMASASKAEEPQGSGGSNPSRCVFSRKYYISFLLFIHKNPSGKTTGRLLFFEYVFNLSETYWSALVCIS